MTPPELLPPGQKRNDDFYDSVTASTKLGYDVTENFDLGFAGRYEQQPGQGHRRCLRSRHLHVFPSPLQTRIDTLQLCARATAHLVLGLRSIRPRVSAIPAPSPATGSRQWLRSRHPATASSWTGRAMSAIADGETLVLGAETARATPSMLPLSRRHHHQCRLCRAAIRVPDLFGGVDFHNSVSVRYDDNSRFGDQDHLACRAGPGDRGDGHQLKASYRHRLQGAVAGAIVRAFRLSSFSPIPTSSRKPAPAMMSAWTRALCGVTGGVTWFHNNISNLIATDPVDILHRCQYRPGPHRRAWKPISPGSRWTRCKLRADYTYTEALDATCTRNWCAGPRTSSAPMRAGRRWRRSASTPACSMSAAGSTAAGISRFPG